MIINDIEGLKNSTGNFGFQRCAVDGAKLLIQKGESTLASFEVDPMIAAGIALYHFFRHEKPFSDADWRAPDTQISSQRENLIRVSVIGYQLFTYLKLIEQKFGPEIAKIIREYQIIALNRLPDQGGDQTSRLLEMIQRAHEAAIKNPIKVPSRPDIEVPIEWPMALHLLCFELTDSPYYVPHDQLKVGNTPKMPDDGLDVILAKCLAYGADAAVEVFGPMVQMIELKLESVSGLVLKRKGKGVKSALGSLRLILEKVGSEEGSLYSDQPQTTQSRNPVFSARSKPPTARSTNWCTSFVV